MKREKGAPSRAVEPYLGVLGVALRWLMRPGALLHVFSGLLHLLGLLTVPFHRRAILRWLRAHVVSQPTLDLPTVWVDGSTLCNVINCTVPGSCRTSNRCGPAIRHAQDLALSLFAVRPEFSAVELELPWSGYVERRLIRYLGTLRIAIDQRRRTDGGAEWSCTLSGSDDDEDDGDVEVEELEDVLEEHEIKAKSKRRLRVLLRIVDFVDEKMILTEDGRLEPIPTERTKKQPRKHSGWEQAVKLLLARRRGAEVLRCAGSILDGRPIRLPDAGNIALSTLLHQQQQETARALTRQQCLLEQDSPVHSLSDLHTVHQKHTGLNVISALVRQEAASRKPQPKRRVLIPQIVTEDALPHCNEFQQTESNDVIDRSVSPPVACEPVSVNTISVITADTLLPDDPTEDKSFAGNVAPPNGKEQSPSPDLAQALIFLTPPIGRCDEPASSSSPSDRNHMATAMFPDLERLLDQTFTDYMVDSQQFHLWPSDVAFGSPRRQDRLDLDPVISAPNLEEALRELERLESQDISGVVPQVNNNNEGEQICDEEECDVHEEEHDEHEEEQQQHQQEGEDYDDNNHLEVGNAAEQSVSVGDSDYISLESIQQSPDDSLLDARNIRRADGQRNLTVTGFYGPAESEIWDNERGSDNERGADYERGSESECGSGDEEECERFWGHSPTMEPIAEEDSEMEDSSSIDATNAAVQSREAVADDAFEEDGRRVSISEEENVLYSVFPTNNSQTPPTSDKVLGYRDSDIPHPDQNEVHVSVAQDKTAENNKDLNHSRHPINKHDSSTEACSFTNAGEKVLTPHSFVTSEDNIRDDPVICSFVDAAPSSVGCSTTDARGRLPVSMTFVSSGSYPAHVPTITTEDGLTCTPVYPHNTCVTLRFAPLVTRVTSPLGPADPTENGLTNKQPVQTQPFTFHVERDVIGTDCTTNIHRDVKYPLTESHDVTIQTNTQTNDSKCTLHTLRPVGKNSDETLETKSTHNAGHQPIDSLPDKYCGVLTDDFVSTNSDSTFATNDPLIKTYEQPKVTLKKQKDIKFELSLSPLKNQGVTINTNSAKIINSDNIIPDDSTLQENSGSSLLFDPSIFAPQDVAVQQNFPQRRNVVSHNYTPHSDVTSTTQHSEIIIIPESNSHESTFHDSFSVNKNCDTNDPFTPVKNLTQLDSHSSSSVISLRRTNINQDLDADFLVSGGFDAISEPNVTPESAPLVDNSSNNDSRSEYSFRTNTYIDCGIPVKNDLIDGPCNEFFVTKTCNSDDSPLKVERKFVYDLPDIKTQISSIDTNNVINNSGSSICNHHHTTLQANTPTNNKHGVPLQSESPININHDLSPGVDIYSRDTADSFSNNHDSIFYKNLSMTVDSDATCHSGRENGDALASNDSSANYPHPEKIKPYPECPDSFKCDVTNNIQSPVKDGHLKDGKQQVAVTTSVVNKSKDITLANDTCDNHDVMKHSYPLLDKKCDDISSKYSYDITNLSKNDVSRHTESFDRKHTSPTVHSDSPIRTNRAIPHISPARKIVRGISGESMCGNPISLASDILKDSSLRKEENLPKSSYTSKGDKHEDYIIQFGNKSDSPSDLSTSQATNNERTEANHRQDMMDFSSDIVIVSSPGKSVLSSKNCDTTDLYHSQLDEVNGKEYDSRAPFLIKERKDLEKHKIPQSQHNITSPKHLDGFPEKYNVSHMKQHRNETLTSQQRDKETARSRPIYELTSKCKDFALVGANDSRRSPIIFTPGIVEKWRENFEEKNDTASVHKNENKLPLPKTHDDITQASPEKSTKKVIEWKKYFDGSLKIVQTDESQRTVMGEKNVMENIGNAGIVATGRQKFESKQDKENRAISPQNKRTGAVRNSHTFYKTYPPPSGSCSKIPPSNEHGPNECDRSPIKYNQESESLTYSSLGYERLKISDTPPQVKKRITSQPLNASNIVNSGSSKSLPCSVPQIDAGKASSRKEETSHSNSNPPESDSRRPIATKKEETFELTKTRFEKAKMFFQMLETPSSPPENAKSTAKCARAHYHTRSDGSSLDSQRSVPGGKEGAGVWEVEQEDLWSVRRETRKAGNDRISCRCKKRKKRNSDTADFHSVPTSDSETVAREEEMGVERETGTPGGSERRKVVERFNVRDLFRDVVGTTENHFMRGIPNREAVLASLRSVESDSVSSGRRSPYDSIEEEEVGAIIERPVSPIPHTYLEEFPYLPTTPASMYRPRSPLLDHSLIPRKDLLKLDF